MDSWEFNKIAGAVLAALLLAFGGGTISGIFTGEEGEAEAKPGYVLPVAAAVDPSKANEAAKPFDVAAVLTQLKTASAENGQSVSKPCSACHTFTKDGKPGVGPNLWGVVGRATGSSSSYPSYSPAMKGHGGNWSFDRLAAYLHDPKEAVPGNKMAFLGIKDNGDLADLLAYLRSLSDSPAPLPN